MTHTAFGNTVRLVAIVGLTLAWATTTMAQDEKPAAPPDAAQMMAKARKYIEPGKNHKHLERFLGKWKTELRIFMGPKAGKPEPGEAEFSWLVPGRWLQYKSTGTMMGMPMEMHSLMGYNNFKQSFVSANINSVDTAMIYSEGDMDPSGKAIISYGTLDEYLTGEHDKMVKSVWRFVSPDSMTLEVHDLPIGENNTKVFEITYTRDGESSAGK